MNRDLKDDLQYVIAHTGIDLTRQTANMTMFQRSFSMPATPERIIVILHACRPHPSTPQKIATAWRIIHRLPIELQHLICTLHTDDPISRFIKTRDILNAQELFEGRLPAGTLFDRPDLHGVN